MNSSWFLARRLLLWRHEGRKLNWSALLSVTGIAVGSAVLILSLSILNGFESQVLDSIRRFENERVLLPKTSQADATATAASLAAIGIQSQPYAERKLVIQAAGGYRLVTARIVPDLAAQMERFEDVIRGTLSYPPYGPGVALGSLLADHLALLPGDEVRLMSPLDISLANPRPPQLSATVRTIYDFGVLDFDEAYIFIDFQAGEQLIPNLSAISGISLTGPGEGWPGDAVSPEEWDLRTWEMEHTDLLTAMKMEKLGSAVVLFLIVLVASFNATSTMVMSVMEKYREIGILRSMGANRRFLKRIFLNQGLLIGLAGVGLGVGLGAMVSGAQMIYGFIPGPDGLTMESSLPMQLRVLDMVMVTVGAVAMSLAAAWYPARYAASIEPGQAVNYQK